MSQAPNTPNPENTEGEQTMANELQLTDDPKVFTRTIPMDSSEPLMLSVSNASGSVRVTGAEQPHILLRARRADGEEIPEEPNILVEVDGNTISVRPEWPLSNSLSGFAQKLKEQLQHGFDAESWKTQFNLDAEHSYHFELTVPKTLAERSKVQVKTASGAVDVADLVARVSVATASGKVSASTMRERLRINTASGAVKVDDMEGNLSVNTASGAIDIDDGDVWAALRTVSGKIELDDVTLRNASIASVSGRVEGDFVADNVADYSFSTVSGRVSLTTELPLASSQATLKVQTASGSSHVSGAWREQSKRNWVAGQGDSGPAFSFKTVSGSVNVVGEELSDRPLRTLGDPEPEAEDDDEPVTVNAEGKRDDDGSVDVEGDGSFDLEGVMNWVRDTARNLTQPVDSPPEPQKAREPQTPTPPAAPVTPPDAPAPEDSGAYNAEQPTGPVDAPWSASGAGQQEPKFTSTSTPAHDAEAQPATTPDSPEDELEQLQVLDALERGEINVDEALARLEGDRNSPPNTSA